MEQYTQWPSQISFLDRKDGGLYLTADCSSGPEFSRQRDQPFFTVNHRWISKLFELSQDPYKRTLQLWHAFLRGDIQKKTRIDSMPLFNVIRCELLTAGPEYGKVVVGLNSVSVSPVTNSPVKKILWVEGISSGLTILNGVVRLVSPPLLGVSSETLSGVFYPIVCHFDHKHMADDSKSKSIVFLAANVPNFQVPDILKKVQEFLLEF